MTHDLNHKRLAAVGFVLTILAVAAPIASAQLNPLDFVSTVTITDNDPGTHELGRDRVAINSTPFKNESLVTVGNYQFTANYRDDGKLMIARRDLTAPTNDWDIRVTEFTSYNINDSHNVPVIGIDGDGYMHLAWGTHNNNLLYTESTTPLTSGQPLSFVGDAVGNSGAINTATGTHETSTTYPNFIRIPGSDDLLFNYRTGSSGNGVYHIARYDDAANAWSWADEDWIANTDSSGLTYNAYPHNMSYDSQGGLHASWTYRYNGSSPTGHSGYQTNHNIFYAYSPDDGVTWYKDMAATTPYPAVINQPNSQVIVNIPEGSSLINTGTQAIDAHDRPAIATWWAPRANDPTPDNRRQYMYVGNDGANWFTSQITHRRSDDPNTPVPESQLGANHMGRPQILFDDYNRAYVVYKDNDNGGGVTVAVSQAESRDDWEFIKLTTANLGYWEPTLDRALWDSSRQMHILTQTIDGNANNGGSPIEIVQWDAAAAMGRVLKWTGDAGSTWDAASVNFTDHSSLDNFHNFDNVTFDDGGTEKTINFAANIDAGKVVVDSSNAYTFSGVGALTSGSLAVVGGGSLELATSGNTYTGQTRVSNATLRITGDATAMTSPMVAADGGTLVMDSSDASTMASSFEIWPTGTLQIGTPTSTGSVFPDHPTSIVNDGLIRLQTSETLQNVTGLGTIEAAAGTTTLQNNPAFQGGVRVKAGATVISADPTALGVGQGSGNSEVKVEDGGQLRVSASGALPQKFNIAGDGGGAGAVQIAASTDVTFSRGFAVNGVSSTIDIGAGASSTVKQAIDGVGGLTKQGAGTLHLKGKNTYGGRTVVRNGQLIVDQSTGFGDTIVDSSGVLAARGDVQGNLVAVGGSVVQVNSSVAPPSGVLFQNNFGGGGAPLDGTTPDVSFDGSSWVAAPTFLDNGDSVSPGGGGSATLAFTPTDGSTYTLETTIENISGDSDWFGFGFANGQSASNGGDTRFINGAVQGLAWALYRGDASVSANQAFLGDTSVPGNGGLASAADWLQDKYASGGDVKLRITLDTTGGPGAWTAAMEADTGSGYHVIRAPQTLLDEAINSIGIANSNSNDVTGKLTAFSLTTDVPALNPIEARTLSIAGNFTLDLGATLKLSLFDENNHDLVAVNGSLDAAGTLEVALDDGAPAPQPGDTFDLLDFGSATGEFAAVDLPTLNTGLYWDKSALLTTGVLAVVDTLPGDYNLDGAVDGADFLAWQRTDGTPEGLANVQVNYGTSASQSAASTAVPEPGTLLLALLAAFGLFGAPRSL